MLWYLYIFIIISSVLIGLIRWRHLSTPLRVIHLLVIIALSVELLKTRLNEEKDYFVEHLYMRVELLVWLCYYYLILAKNKRIWLMICAILFIVAIYILKLFFHVDHWGVNYYDYVLLAVCVSTFTGIFFWELVFKPMNYSIKEDGNFWVNCGNFLFYPGLVFAFGFTTYFDKGSPFFAQWLGTINHILNLVLYILYGFAFYFHKRKRKASLTFVYNRNCSNPCFAQRV